MRRFLLPALVVLLVVAAAYLWLESGTSGGPQQGGHARHDRRADEEPRLIGHEAADVRVHDEAAETTASEREPVVPEVEWDEVTFLPFRIRDRAGRLILGATLEVVVERDGEEVTIGGSVRSGLRVGTLCVGLDERIVSAVVEVPAPDGRRIAMERRDPDGISPGELLDVWLDDLVLLPVRTVDARGQPRARQRILYRPREEDEPNDGWWGSTSDEEGWCRLGPFPLRTRVEIRPGPRGTSDEETGDPTGWTGVVADGTPVDLCIGDAPVLRLSFPDERGGERLRIAVLDATTFEPVLPPHTHDVAAEVWTAPATREGRRLHVVVGPLADGRVAVLREILPAWDPIPVRLRPGEPLEGRVVLDDRDSDVTGTVTVFGRGLRTWVKIAADGVFRFPGLPGGDCVLYATVRCSSNGRVFAGALDLEDGARFARIPLVSAVRIDVALVVLSDDGAEPWPAPWLRGRAEATTPRLSAPLVHYPQHPRFSLHLLPGPWRLALRVGMEDGVMTGEVDLGNVIEDRTVVVPLRER